MTKYKQLSQEQRYVIGRLLKAGKDKAEIATAIGVDRSTVYRELKRNIPKRGRGAKLYRPDKAQQKTALRHKLKPKYFSFTADMRKQIVKWLTVEKLSPELTPLERVCNACFSFRLRRLCEENPIIHLRTYSLSKVNRT